MADLRSPGQELQKVDSVVKVMAYQVPADKAAAVAEQLKMLDAGTLEYGSREAFAANSFWSGKGSLSQWPVVQEQLTGLDGQFMGHQNLLIFDENPEFFAGYPTSHGQSLTFFRANGSVAVREVSRGVFKWSLRFRRQAGEIPMAQLVLIPEFESSVTEYLKRIGKPADGENFTIGDLSLKTMLQAGDFVVLTVAEDKKAVNSLHWFFQSPNVRREHVLVYVIMYAGAGNP